METLQEIDYRTYLNVYEDIPKLNDYILLSQKGIWEVNHIDQNNIIWCGGLKTDLRFGIDKCWIIPNQSIKALQEIENKFKVNDYVKGYDRYNKLAKGSITDFHWTSIEMPFWIKNDKGFALSLQSEGIELTEKKHSFFEWIKIYN